MKDFPVPHIYLQCYAYQTCAMHKHHKSGLILDLSPIKKKTNRTKKSFMKWTQWACLQNVQKCKPCYVVLWLAAERISLKEVMHVTENNKKLFCTVMTINKYISKQTDQDNKQLNIHYPKTCRGWGFWPVLQPATRGQLGCFGSLSGSFYVTHTQWY